MPPYFRQKFEEFEVGASLVRQTYHFNFKGSSLGRLQYKHVEPIAGFPKRVKKIVYPPLKECEKMFYPPPQLGKNYSLPPLSHASSKNIFVTLFWS